MPDASERLVEAGRQLEALLEQRRETLAFLDRVVALQQLPGEALVRAGVDLAFVGAVEQAGQITLRNLAGHHTSLLQDLVVEAGLGMGGAALVRGIPVTARNYASDDSFTHHFDRQVLGEGIAAVLAVPIVHEGQIMGVLYGAGRRPQEFADTQIAVMEQLGRRAGAQLHVAARATAQAEAAVQAERDRVSAELHDSLGAMLFTINAEVRDLHADPAVSPDLAARLQRISGHLSEAGMALRESLSALRASPESVRLPAALRGDCRAFTERTGVHARAVMLSDLPPLEEHRAAALGSAAREALVNVEKHSTAKNVMVTAVAQGGGVLVVVTDDGQGARDVSPGESSGTGLATANLRLEQVGGRLSCFSDEEDGGWTVRAWVPVL